MKKPIDRLAQWLVVSAFVIGAGGTLQSCKQQTASERVLEKIKKLDHKDILFDSNFNILQGQLAEAYLTDGRADDAITLFSQLIDQEEGGGSGILKLREYRRVTKKHDMDALLASSLAVDAIYYKGLARAFEIKQDKKRAKEAADKAARIESESEALKGSADREKTAELDQKLK